MTTLLAIQLIAAFIIGVLFAELVIPALNNHSAKKRVQRRERVVTDLVYEGWSITNPEGTRYVPVTDPDETIPYQIQDPASAKSDTDAWINFNEKDWLPIVQQKTDE